MNLYDFIQEFTLDDLPGSTRERLVVCLRDILGVAAGARDSVASRALREYALAHHRPSALASRLLFDGRAVHPLGAAWAGGFSIDSLDAHEGHFTSKGHAGATVVPALLALVDAFQDRGRAITGAALLEALCIGYETALRAGRALMASTPQYHASGAFSALGVVCGGARLLGLNEASFRHALGIAEYFAPRCPMMRLIDHPSMLRDAHGAGAHAGINALLLAQAGVTGAPAALVELGDSGACWDDLGRRWEIDAQYFKPWPVCRWAQPALTAVQALRERSPDWDASTVERIRVETFHESMRLQGHAPTTPDEAQYALAFPLAALICRGRVGAWEVSEAALQAADIRALSQRIEIVEAPDLSRAFPERLLSRVCVRLVDGRELLSPTTAAIGDPDKPMGEIALHDKFITLSSASLTPAHQASLEASIVALVDAGDCADLLYWATLGTSDRAPACSA
ncbi:MmgE/PrpD family protein [Halomonas sp. V046]|uniref:MmgE/PrpD family protein n=1 Tax=Halomonas sp. V046 TaxID=3459611 RepID=UPI00404470BD